MRSRLKEMLIRHEGIRFLPYRDTEGHWTLGVGHRLTNGLSKQVVMMILDEDINWVMDACQGLSYWNRLNEPRQVVVASMIFNLGVAGFRRFRRLNARLEAEQWDAAAKEMMFKNPDISDQLSSWAKQIGDGPGGRMDRVEELCAIMRVGEFRGVEI